MITLPTIILLLIYNNMNNEDKYFASLYGVSDDTSLSGGEYRVRSGFRTAEGFLDDDIDDNVDNNTNILIVNSQQ